MKHVVVLGAGYAGVLTAIYLEKKLGSLEDISISLIDRNTYHTMRTEIHAAATGRMDPQSIAFPLEKIFARRKVRIITDTITEIDRTAKRITGTAGVYDYDYLVLAAGSKPCYFGIPGASENVFPLWTLDDAVRLKKQIETQFLKASETQVETQIETQAEKQRLLTFHVVGAGLTGVELAGELAEYARLLCARYSLPYGLVNIVMADALPRAVPNLPERLSDKVEKHLKDMGVSLVFSAKVIRVDDNAIVLEINGKQSSLPTGTVIWSAGIECADISQFMAKNVESCGRGRITQDGLLRSVADTAVYVAGDNMFYLPPGKKSPVPQMVENCEQSAKAVADNIAADVTGNGRTKQYKPSFHGVMISIGNDYAVAQIRMGPFKMSVPSPVANSMKRFINVMYLTEVLGISQVFHCIRHEFFTKRK